MSERHWLPLTDQDCAWCIGQVAQAIVMGILLLFAILGLLAVANNALPFQYQGF